MPINTYQIELSAKIALGKFVMAELSNDSLPKIVIVGIAYCYAEPMEQTAKAVGMNKKEYMTAINTFRKAAVACTCRRATAHQQQIVDATREVDKTIRAMYLPKQYVEL